MRLSFVRKNNCGLRIMNIHSEGSHKLFQPNNVNTYNNSIIEQIEMIDGAM